MNRRSVLAAMGSGVGLMGLEAADPQAAAQKPGRWLQVESANFIVLSSINERDTREEIAALEAFHRLMMTFLPNSADYGGAKLAVHIAATDRDFRDTAPGMGSDVAGFYQAGVENVRAVTVPKRATERQRDMNRNIRAMDSRVILFHEYAHHRMFANTRTRYPSWYVEGFAEYFSTVVFMPQGAQIGMMTRNRATWLLAGLWMPIEKFLTSSPNQLDSEDSAQFYAQAWLATHMMLNKPDWAAKFDRYVQALMKGGDVMGSFEPTFGMSPATFDRELRSYKSSGLVYRMAAGFAADPQAPMAVSRLNAAADDVVMPLGHLMELPGEKRAEDSVAAIRKNATKFPDDPYVAQADAYAEIWYGDLTAARKKVDALLAVVASPQTEHLSGLCDLRMAYAAEDEALFTRARGAFARAYKLDDTRASSLFRYAECEIAISGQFDEATTNVMVESYRLRPQVAAVGVMAAQALMENKRFEEAAIVLRPFAAHAHGGSMRVISQKLLDDALAERMPSRIAVGWARPIRTGEESASDE